MKYICKQCGKEFELEQAEIEFYENRNLDLPKRCKDCRNANKRKKRQRTAEYRKKKSTAALTESAKKTPEAAQQGEERKSPGKMQQEHGRRTSGTRQPGNGRKVSENRQPGMEKTDYTVKSGYKGKPQEAGKPEYAAKTTNTENQRSRRTASGAGNVPDSANIKNTDDRRSRINTPDNRKHANGFWETIIVILAMIMMLCAMFVWKRSQNGNPSEPPAARIQESDDGDGAESGEAKATSVSGLVFRSKELLQEHYQKHGIEMGFDSAEAYESAAAMVAENAAALHKLEAEDGDDVYYLEETNEFVIVSTDGYIRTYFCPNDGIEYYNRQ